MFLYRSLFITYLCFCSNCTCRSVNISTISFNSMLSTSLFLYQYQNVRATFFCVVVCLKVDLVHVLLISRTFNSDNFLHATYIIGGGGGGWGKLNNWITIIHYSLLFFSKLFIIHFKFFHDIHYSFYGFCISFPFRNFLQCNSIHWLSKVYISV